MRPPLGAWDGGDRFGSGVGGLDGCQKEKWRGVLVSSHDAGTREFLLVLLVFVGPAKEI